jgi:hypothetical protein
MVKKCVAVVDDGYIESLKVIVDKVNCAGQLVRPDAVPQNVSPVEAMCFFREAIFSRANAQYLRDVFWRDLARQYDIKPEFVNKLYLDIHTRRMFIDE